jgi:hypothetical protein
MFTGLLDSTLDRVIERHNVSCERLQLAPTKCQPGPTGCTRIGSIALRPATCRDRTRRLSCTRVAHDRCDAPQALSGAAVDASG